MRHGGARPNLPRGPRRAQTVPDGRLECFGSQKLAGEAATLLERMTGDICRVAPTISDRTGGINGWRIVRTDWSGKVVKCNTREGER